MLELFKALRLAFPFQLRISLFLAPNIIHYFIPQFFRWLIPSLRPLEEATYGHSREMSKRLAPLYPPAKPRLRIFFTRACSFLTFHEAFICSAVHPASPAIDASSVSAGMLTVPFTAFFPGPRTGLLTIGSP